MTKLEKFKPLSKEGLTSLRYLFDNGPSRYSTPEVKNGIRDLISKDMVDVYNDFFWLNRDGVILAIALEIDRIVQR